MELNTKEVGDTVVKRFIVTGGRGTGKTTLIDKIADSTDYLTFQDPSRRLVRRYLGEEEGPLPWEDPLEFGKELLPARVRQYKDVGGTNRVCFYDRGIPDGIAFLEIDDVEIPAEFYEAAREFRYDGVFWLPPWREIYEQNDERPEDWQKSKELGEAIKALYSNLGYDPIMVPKEPPSQRVHFVIDRIT